jgi:galactokinase
MAVDPQAVRSLFARVFNTAPAVLVQAPGRINLMGEHTDYNDGFVLPMAIERNTVVAARPRADRTIQIYSAQFDEMVCHSLDTLGRDSTHPWSDYVTGMAWAVEETGRRLGGADLAIMGDVPLGCGLSSSASLEMAVLSAFEALGGFEFSTSEAARLGQRTENGFLGLKSGIMDHFAVRGAQAGCALFLDCRSLESEQIPVRFDGAVFVVANTNVSRGLTGSKYNDRVRECAEAVGILTQHVVGEKLRDFTQSDLDQTRYLMNNTLFRRARHVISENQRTLAAREALRLGDAGEFGRLMDASDASLRDDYAVSCQELDVMTAIGRDQPGCYGARMTGAGFGGCTIHLVREAEAAAFVEALLTGYAAATGLQGEAFLTAAAGGWGRLP